MGNNKFKIGDVVVLKSDGPEMTIEQIEPNGEFVQCTWFDGGRRERDSFHIDIIDFTYDDTEDDF